MKRICVVIPMFNKADLTDRCVEMTVANAGIECDILVVDDGSEIPYENGSINVLRLNENSGFTNATNQGILWCSDRYEFIHLLNNDTEPEPNFISTLLDVMDNNSSIGIASSSRIHNEADGSFACIENYGLDLVRGHQLISRTNLPDDVIFIDWLPTCSALMRLEMIREIGLLDKQFRNHCSDSEYCIRANMNQWNVALVPKSRVLHHWSLTTSENKINPSEDQNKFIAKLAGLKYAELMKRVPLDCEQKTYGSLQFMTYNK